MKKELTNEQIARVRSLYLGCDVQKADESGTFTLSPHVLSQMSLPNTLDSIKNGKLLLTPLSEISDEDAIEVAKIIMGDYFSQNAKPFIERKDEEILLNVQGWNIIRIHYKDGTILWSEQNRDWRFRYNNKIPFAFQYLIQKGYAVPLFIEPNHPLNGKTAIELGLAIDKTKEVSHG